MEQRKRSESSNTKIPFMSKIIIANFSLVTELHHHQESSWLKEEAFFCVYKPAIAKSK
jgi:hypothetical protein